MSRPFTLDDCPLRTARVSDCRASIHVRVIRTLPARDLRLAACLFLGGLDKGACLKSLGAAMLFDDQHSHCASARAYVMAGHVPHGISNAGPRDRVRGSGS